MKWLTLGNSSPNTAFTVNHTWYTLCQASAWPYLLHTICNLQRKLQGVDTLSLIHCPKRLNGDSAECPFPLLLLLFNPSLLSFLRFALPPCAAAPPAPRLRDALCGLLGLEGLAGAPSLGGLLMVEGAAVALLVVEWLKTAESFSSSDCVVTGLAACSSSLLTW